MRRRVPVIALLAGAGLAGDVEAQDRETRTTLTLAPTFVRFWEFAGPMGAGVAQLSVTRGLSTTTGIDVTAVALAPLGGATAIAGCVPGAVCPTLSTPALVAGVLGSLVLQAGGSGLRASFGGGVVKAIGGEGLSERSSLVAGVGLHWNTRPKTRIAPTFTVRFLTLATPLADARYLVLPGVGVSF